MYKRVYVDVLTLFDKEGNIIPVSIKWEDGKFFDIDKVIQVKRAPALKAGGMGMRYACSVEGKETYLFFEDPRWFVEINM